jgi:hypothetical protein
MDNPEEKQIESTIPNEVEKNWKLNFKYQDRNFQVQEERHNNFATIKVLEEEQLEVGKITGSYIQRENSNEVVFEVSETKNEGMEDVEDRDPLPTINHIRYLIAETVIQLLLIHKVDRLISSYALNMGSTNMYLHIAEDGRMKVETIFNENGVRYEVTRQPESSNPK